MNSGKGEHGDYRYPAKKGPNGTVHFASTVVFSRFLPTQSRLELRTAVEGNFRLSQSLGCQFERFGSGVAKIRLELRPRARDAVLHCGTVRA